MKIAVVGDTGFIGSHLIKSLNEKEIFNIGFNTKSPIFQNDSTLVTELINVDCIIWASGTLNPGIASNQPVLVKREYEHWDKTISALENSDFCLSKKKIVFLSSGGCVYDYSDEPIKEDYLACGSNEYGRTKVKMENRLLAGNLNSTILRVSNVYGFGQKTGRGQGVIAEWLRAIRDGTPIKVYGNMTSSRDYIHVRDLVSAITLAGGNSFQGILNIGSGVSTTLAQILETFSASTEIPLEIELGGSREADKQNYLLDIEKAKKILGWVPLIEIREGIEELIKHQSGRSKIDSSFMHLP